MNGTEITPFVVVATARSGTSLLVETLNTHPDIYCHGEIFHEIVEWHIRQEYRDRFDVSLRETDPVKYCYSVLSFSPGERVVGFKMWGSQSEVACDALLRDPSVKKIIMERDNKLAQFSSGQLARTTGMWNVGPGADVSKIRTARATFGREAFLNFARTHQDIYSYYRKAAAGEVLNLSYTDVASLQFDPIFAFLGVAPMPVTASKARLHSSNILSRYEDDSHDAIVRTLEEIGRPEWVREHIPLPASVS